MPVCHIYQNTCHNVTSLTFLLCRLCYCIVAFVRASSLSLTFTGCLIAIWVHRGHDVNAGIVDQLSDLQVSTIVTAQVLNEVKH